ncbi:MAG TPA: RNA 2',3'-cyclic phosphodiesterase [Candidatus Methylomirabilis sp.]|nr:RNA 2',3'-cyclic phosphodiesterase [Candidatus Methylomirabilis sp.]
MRLFVAMNLSTEIRERLAAAQDRLRRAQADVSWVRPENLHVTLKFLGETEEKRLGPIRLALAEVGRAAAPFTMAVAGSGSFGGRVPRVVWAGVRDGAQPLIDLARNVEGVLARVGFPKEKREFTAHLTLGRVRSPRNADGLLAALQEVRGEPFGILAAREFELMQSELRPSGSIYTVLERFPLGTA